MANLQQYIRDVEGDAEEYETSVTNIWDLVSHPHPQRSPVVTGGLAIAADQDGLYLRTEQGWASVDARSGLPGSHVLDLAASPAFGRVWVGTDIPVDEIPGENQNDRVVFREAATGRLLAISELLPFMTQGSAVQPGYGGSVFFPGGEGTLVKLTPSPRRSRN